MMEQSPINRRKNNARGQLWPEVLRKHTVRADLAKLEWDEIVRTGRKTTETRRILCARWNVEYSLLCRWLRGSRHLDYRRDPVPPTDPAVLAAAARAARDLLLPYPALYPAHAHDAEPESSPQAYPQQSPTPTPTPTPTLAAATFPPAPRGPGRPRRPNGTPRRLNSVAVRAAENSLGPPGNAWPGDENALLSDSEEAVILLWFRFRLEVADLVSVPELVDAANLAISVSTVGSEATASSQTMAPATGARAAFPPWAQEFMLCRTDLFWSTVKYGYSSEKQRPEPDEHSFWSWFFGPSGPEDKTLKPRGPYLNQANANAAAAVSI
ncbi:hypothetical protein RB598_007336 [Gaeumannomyces tritici]